MGKMQSLRVFRVLVLLAILSGAFLLYEWSRSADPRFYRFVQTPYGQALAKIFRWYDSPLEKGVDDKPIEKWSEEELAVARAMEERIRKETPSHRLVLKNNKFMEGTLLEVNPDYITFQEFYGDSGSLSVKVQQSRIERVVELIENLPKVTYKDVRFQLEFPEMLIYKRPPYTIATDETYFHVERSVRILQQLHQEFLDLFEPLITKPRKTGNIQLAFFSNEEMFREYQQKYVPRMSGCLGFYSPALDRFLVFNLKRSDHIRNLSSEVAEKERIHTRIAPSNKHKERVRVWKRKAQRNLVHQAEQQTFTTLRHEGSHQLFFTCGVHSSFRIENDWLVEGLAVFCENEHIGRNNSRRASLVRSKIGKNQQIPLPEVVNFRNPNGFLAMEDVQRVELAYSEAWTLVRYLMEQHRNGFFEYIRYLRNPEHIAECMDTPRFKLLCRFLQTSPEKLTSDWADYVATL